MRKFRILLALLMVLSFSGVAFGWGGGDGSRYAQLQETAVFLNNSGHTLSAGDVVILDTVSEDSTTGSTLGAYVRSTQSVDSRLAVGVVKSTSVANGYPVVVVTRGPVDTYVADYSDPVTKDQAVGTSEATSATWGHAGGGNYLGIALENGDGTDGDLIYVWVNPTGAAKLSTE